MRSRIAIAILCLVCRVEAQSPPLPPGSDAPPAAPASDSAPAAPAAEVDQQPDGGAQPAETPQTNQKPPSASSDDEAPADDNPVAGLPDEMAAETVPEAKAPEASPPPTPVAEDVDLSEPVVDQEQAPAPPATSPAPEPAPDAVAAEEQDNPGRPLVLLGETVAPGTSARLSWSLDQRFDGITVPTPVLVVNGSHGGPVLCLTAAVHGDELNGIEIVRRVLYDLEPETLRGTVIGVPIVNLQGFRRGSRYLPDRRDLNRFFPGSVSGSSASRIAHSFFNDVIRACSALVDIHTGSFHRTNLPQLRADLTIERVTELSQAFGATAVLHSTGSRGTLRRAAVLAGIPTVTLETGEPGRLQVREVEHGTKGVQTLLTKMGLTRRVRVWGEPEPVYYKSVWVRANQGGLLFGQVTLGQRVREGQVLGTITDPITNVRSELTSPEKGRILGMALNQVVMPGFAAFRIGIPSSEDALTELEDTADETLPKPPTGSGQRDDEDENS